MTQKYGAWTVPGSRETARIAWRERVNAAARDWMTSGARTLWLSLTWHPRKSYSWRLHAALTAPRPWRSSQRPDPRRRYSRSHRRACVSCREVWRVTVMCGMRNGVGDAGTERGWIDPSGCAASMRRDPHGEAVPMSDPLKLADEIEAESTCVENKRLISKSCKDHKE